MTLLHCTAQHPAPPESVNLRAMETLSRAFGLETGYSDDTAGTTAAVAPGARVIEKHFTLDRSLLGPDHKAFLIPEELTALVSAVRETEKMLGGGPEIAGPRRNRQHAHRAEEPSTQSIIYLWVVFFHFVPRVFDCE